MAEQSLNKSELQLSAVRHFLMSGKLLTWRIEKQREKRWVLGLISVADQFLHPNTKRTSTLRPRKDIDDYNSQCGDISQTSGLQQEKFIPKKVKQKIMYV